MKDLRIGECLWSQWEGEGLDPNDSRPIFYTEGHVDVEHGLVRRALASALQRDDVASTLGQSFMLVDHARIETGYAGTVDKEIYLTACDEEGLTAEGDEVDDVLEMTWVFIR